MAFCTNCGKQMADGVKFCTACGTPVTAPAAPAPIAPSTATAPMEPAAPVVEQQAATPPVQPVQQAATVQPPVQQPMAAQPVYAPQPVAPAAVYQEEPISTGSYIGIFFLMMIPIVNLIFLIVWACGGCAKRNKTNLARALLVWMLIGAVLGGLVLLAGSLLFGDTLDSIRELGSQIGTAAGE